MSELVCLAIMAKDSPEEVLKTIRSASPYVDSVCLVVAPGDPLLNLADALPLPGQIFEEPWRGYGETRTRTLRHAERYADRVLMIDAGDTFAPGGALPPADDPADAWSIVVDLSWPDGRWRWTRTGHLMRARAGFSWTGGVHETLTLPPGARLGMCRSLVYVSGPAKETPGRYAADAEALRETATTDPRSAFYYAQSQKDAGRIPEAVDAFLARASMGGFDEEVFWSLLWAAWLTGRADLYARAHEHSPERAEPLRGLRRHAEADACEYPSHLRSFVDVNAYSDRALARAGVI